MKDKKTGFQKVLYSPLTKIIVGFGVVLGVTVLVQLTCNSVLANTGMASEYKNAVIGILTAFAALLSYILLFRFYEKRKITELSLVSFGKNALLGLATGAILQSLVILVIYLAGGYAIISFNPVSFLLSAFAVALTSAVTEEILIRGIVFRIAEEKLGTIVAIIISGLLFGLLHLGNPGATLYSAMSIAIEAGILLAAAYTFSRSLWLPIFLHFAWNFTEAGIYGAVISGNTVKKSLITSKITGPELLTGGQFGPENSIQATIFCLAAGLLFLWAAKRNNKFIAPFWQTKPAIKQS